MRMYSSRWMASVTDLNHHSPSRRWHNSEAKLRAIPAKPKSYHPRTSNEAYFRLETTALLFEYADHSKMASTAWQKIKNTNNRAAVRKVQSKPNETFREMISANYHLCLTRDKHFKYKVWSGLHGFDWVSFIWGPAGVWFAVADGHAVLWLPGRCFVTTTHFIVHTHNWEAGEEEEGGKKLKSWQKNVA